MTTASLKRLSALTARHRANMARLLVRRFQAAEARHDAALMAQLRQEERQLVNSTATASSVPAHPIRRIWNQVMNIVMHWSDLKVSEFTDSQGQHWWYGYDPITGRAIYAESDNELRSWIETYYAGR
ncbi:MAG: hypothetical protein ACTS2F_03370 [Thainema sp.]